MIQGEIRKVVKKIEDINKRHFDVIIGLGMEGNIMSTQLLLDDSLYTYLPYTYRYVDFNDFEKDICITNEDGKYKSVLVITDVVNKGRTLKNLIEEEESGFFENVENIQVVSLFYTGNQKDMMMPIGLRDINDKKIDFFSLMQLEVGECPYGDDFKEKCAIFEKELCEVYKFNSER